MINNKILKYSLLFVTTVLIIYNPYTIFGKIGTYAALVLTAYFFMYRYEFAKVMSHRDVKCFYVIMFVGMFGVMSSQFNNIFQYNHLLAVFIFMLYYSAALGFSILARNAGLDVDSVMLLIGFAIILNSLVVLLEFYSPPFRVFVESFLLENVNRNYSEGFRYRGIASSGGASLSIAAPVGVLIFINLWQRKKIQFITFVLSVVVIFLSLLLIGRTGLMLMVIPVLYYVYITSRLRVERAIINLSCLIVTFMAAAFVFIEYFVSSLIEKYGEFFIFYSLGFLIDGLDGLFEEGTVSIVSDHLFVLPVDLPYIFTGYGFYGGSDFSPWTDSGFARTFLSVGYFFGFIFYYCIYKLLVRKWPSEYFALFLAMLVVLVVGEIKEPMLISGYAFRAFLFLSVFAHYFLISTDSADR